MRLCTRNQRAQTSDRGRGAPVYCRLWQWRGYGSGAAAEGASASSPGAAQPSSGYLGGELSRQQRQTRLPGRPSGVPEDHGAAALIGCRAGASRHQEAHLDGSSSARRLPAGGSLATDRAGSSEGASLQGLRSKRLPCRVSCNRSRNRRYVERRRAKDIRSESKSAAGV